MVLLGLGVLIASVSFLCYHHPPRSWSFLSWLQRPSIKQGVDREKRGNAPARVSNNDGSLHTEKHLELEETNSKEEIDRKSMPPPPPTFMTSSPQPSPPTTPRATQVPTFSLHNSHDQEEDEEDDADNLPPPSFPALNSAQRASKPSPQPPLLNPSASNLMPPPPRPSPKSNHLNTPGLSVPSRTPLPNRTPPSSSFGLAPPPTHTSIPAKPSKKVLLTPGHSPLDWARLSSSPTANLRGLPLNTPYLRVPPSLLKYHNGRKPSKMEQAAAQKEGHVLAEGAKKDAWTVLGGKVYNITPYIPFHPGGEPELIRVAGKDGTRLFGEVHPWVNWEGMLESCLIGIYVSEEEAKKENSLEDMD